MATTMTPKKPEANEVKPVTNVAARSWTDFPLSLRHMREEFDRWFDRALSRDRPAFLGMNGWRWDVTTTEKEDALVVRAEAPGFEAGDFDVRVEDNRLVLHASRRTESKEKDKESVHEMECSETIALPCGVERDKVEASYRNGVLTVTMPKSVEAKGRKVTVKPG